jgi:protein-S-isoprenylcysteine O-methyltransferase Ste14
LPDRERTSTHRAWLVRNVPLPEAHLACLAAGYGLHRLRPWRLPGRRPVQRLLGSIAAGAGGYLVVRSVHAAARVDLARPERLVTAYPYTISRNPMYVGWALLHLGAGLIAGSGWIIASLPAAVAWVRLDIRREERRLAETLGPEYERYRAAVPRYL